MSLNVFSKKLELMVRDDGSGFDANQQASGMGIRNMRERAALIDGDLRIDTAPGQGTRVTLIVPVPKLIPPTA